MEVTKSLIIGLESRSMDLTVIKGLGPARREKLESAGVETIDGLSDAGIEELSEEVGISASLLNDFQQQAKALVRLKDLEGVGPANLEKLVEADVRSLKDLSRRDAAELNEATGIPVDKLKAWRRKAGTMAAADHAKATADQARQTAEQLAGQAKRELEDARVVLQEGISEARVKVEQDVLAEARILPIRAKDEVDKVLENVRGNVIVLREKADTAMVRLEDSVYEGIPIFKEKLSEAQDRATEEMTEVRVRVQEIRDKRVIPKADSIKQRLKGLFGKDDQ